MPKIIWAKHFEAMTESLHNGVSVRDTAAKLGVGYATLCKYLSSLSMNPNGTFKDRVSTDSANLEEYFSKYILKNYGQIQDIVKTFGLTAHQVQNLMRTYSLRKEWDFVNSTSENVKFGRKAELWVKSRPEFQILSDKIKTDSKSPYDLVVKGYGAVDVKATKLRGTPSGGYRWKFNVENVCKPTKYVFLVGYDEACEVPEILIILPFKEIKGKQSISISKTKLSDSKYFSSVFLKLYSEDSSEEDN